MTRPAARGWKGQSLLVHAHMTRKGGPCHRQGLMPAFARAALDIVIEAGRLAGLAKKRWRDGDPERLTIDAVRRARRTIDAAFDRLEACVDAPPAGTESGTALASHARHGLVGLLAIGLAEEACELAEPIARLAEGSASHADVAREIADESADLRTYLHLSDTAFNVDPVSTTQAKWDAFVARVPETAAEALNPARRDADRSRTAARDMMLKTIEDQQGDRR